MQGPREGQREVEGGRLLHEAETDLRHAGELVPVAGHPPRRADEVEVCEHQGDHLVRIRDPRLGGPDRDAERREARMRDAGPRAEALRPTPFLERREEAAPAFVTDEMRDESERLRPVVRPEGRDREREGEGADLPDRGDVEASRKEAFAKERGVDAKTLHRAALHRREPGPDEPLQVVEGLAAEDHQLHQVGGVGVLVEVDELGPELAAGALGEGRLVPGVEPGEGMVRIEGLLPRREASQVVAAAARHVLGVDDPPLAREVFAVEARVDEELGEPVERAFEMRRVDFEEVGRVREAGAGVAEPAVLGEEAVVLLRFGILLGSEKQQVLEEVRKPRARFRVVRAPHVHVERRRRPVGVRVGDDEGLESVAERDRAIAPRVGGASLDLDPAPAPERRRGAGEEQREGRPRENTERGRGSETGQRRTPGGGAGAPAPRPGGPPPRAGAPIVQRLGWSEGARRAPSVRPGILGASSFLPSSRVLRDASPGTWASRPRWVQGPPWATHPRAGCPRSREVHPMPRRPGAPPR